jgi:hypothetical protein
MPRSPMGASPGFVWAPHEQHHNNEFGQEHPRAGFTWLRQVGVELLALWGQEVDPQASPWIHKRLCLVLFLFFCYLRFPGQCCGRALALLQ